MYQHVDLPAAGLHDVDGRRTHMFHDLVSAEGDPLIRIVVGRAPHCAIRVMGKYTSAAHLIMERQSDGSMVVHDVGSHNGIFVNGVFTTEPFTLMVGTRIRLGTSYVLGVDVLGRYPISAVTVEQYLHNAYEIYGKFSVAAERVGVSPDTVRTHHRRFIYRYGR